MRVAIHQPNFIPWFPYFYKMAAVDLFILLKTVQFEKNGYQNRFNYRGKWITKPVHRGMVPICQKEYLGIEGYGNERFGVGQEGSLARLNEEWIRVIAKTLNIKTKIADDYLFSPHPDDKTDKLIDIIKSQTRGVEKVSYVTNPDAVEKYLDVEKMLEAGIDIKFINAPMHLRKSTFEVIEHYGIEGAIKQLPNRKDKLCKVSSKSLIT